MGWAISVRRCHKPRSSQLSPPSSDHHHDSLPLSTPSLHPSTTQAGRQAVQCRQATMANASMRAAAAQYINPAVKLSHKTTVIRLYRKSLKTLNAWYVYACMTLVACRSLPRSLHP